MSSGANLAVEPEGDEHTLKNAEVIVLEKAENFGQPDHHFLFSELDDLCAAGRR